MKWNSNVSLKNMVHEPHEKIYGQLYGKILTSHDIPFPDNQDLGLISKATAIEKHYPELMSPSKDAN